MITPDYVQLMARYSAWQNKSIFNAADSLGDVERRLDRGAFFQSIHETLNHILWADQLWLHRLADMPMPAGPGIPQSTDQFGEWEELKQVRFGFDDMIQSWAMNISPDDLSGDLVWYSGAIEAEMTKPRTLLIAHMFNHGTHHRGQVHGMLTACGAKPEDTDIPFMPA